MKPIKVAVLKDVARRAGVDPSTASRVLRGDERKPAKAETRERVNWVFAFFGEHSELFEVGAQEKRPCILCQGTGLESHTDQTGQVTSFLCRRCAGSQYDVTAKFR